MPFSPRQEAVLRTMHASGRVKHVFGSHSEGNETKMCLLCMRWWYLAVVEVGGEVTCSLSKSTTTENCSLHERTSLTSKSSKNYIWFTSSQNKQNESAMTNMDPVCFKRRHGHYCGWERNGETWLYRVAVYYENFWQHIPSKCIFKKPFPKVLKMAN